MNNQTDTNLKPANQPFKLTAFSHGSGCGCKIAPSVLDEILKQNENDMVYSHLLVGNESKDDAAVYDLGNGQALISTTDFFMPIVDDASDFGKIAACNAISDIYAMGGKPIMAVAILGWPVDKLPSALAREVVSGGRQLCREAGIPLAGGHSIDSPEPIFGLAVNGLVPISQLKKNSTARPGDLLFITKPLGIGIINTAIKRNKADKNDEEEVIKWMITLNRFGEVAGYHNFIHAMTDVTGFGLLGHALEMAEGSNLSAEIFLEKVPLLNRTGYFLDQFIFPDMTTRNFNSFKDKMNDLSARQLLIGCDPQTSGGLLLAVDPYFEKEFISLCRENQLTEISQTPIGIMHNKLEKTLLVR